MNAPAVEDERGSLRSMRVGFPASLLFFFAVLFLVRLLFAGMTWQGERGIDIGAAYTQVAVEAQVAYRQAGLVLGVLASLVVGIALVTRLSPDTRLEPSVLNAASTFLSLVAVTASVMVFLFVISASVDPAKWPDAALLSWVSGLIAVGSIFSSRFVTNTEEELARTQRRLDALVFREQRYFRRRRMSRSRRGAPLWRVQIVGWFASCVLAQWAFFSAESGLWWQISPQWTLLLATAVLLPAATWLWATLVRATSIVAPVTATILSSTLFLGGAVIAGVFAATFFGLSHDGLRLGLVYSIPMAVLLLTAVAPVPSPLSFGVGLLRRDVTLDTIGATVRQRDKLLAKLEREGPAEESAAKRRWFRRLAGV